MKKIFSISLKLCLLVVFYFYLYSLLTKSYYYKTELVKQINTDKNKNITNSDVLITRSAFVSKCKCRKEKIILDEFIDYYHVKIEQNKTITKEYTITKEQTNRINCDLYNALRRGPNRKVIGYSLYGRNLKYYNHIHEIISIAFKLYPNWIIRIHYNDSILTDYVCKLECLKDENNTYFDNIDFCDINRMPNSLVDKSDTWDASYMHAMNWRWFPIGDSFVDYFGSRDTDAWPVQREVDSVNVWLNSSTLFHVMRDHPKHHIPILGGLWGFANVRNRSYANFLFSMIKNETIANVYYEGSRKGRDQHFLADHFYKYARLNATIHDSFHCNLFNDSKPFPSQRTKANCYLSCYYCCDEKRVKSKWKEKCPVECRPKNHQDWEFC